MKVLTSLTLLILIAVVGHETARAQRNDKPITEDGLVRLLESKIPSPALVRAIESRGVAFQLTSLLEQELAHGGVYLGKRGLAAILTAIRENFRPPAVRPYRLSYRLLKGRAVDLLLEGKIGRWDKELSGKYFIVRNEVLKTLSELVTKFSEDFVDDKFFRVGGPRLTSRKLATEYSRQEKPMFVGDIGAAWLTEYAYDRSLLVGELFTAAPRTVAALINSLNDSNEQWRFYAFRAEEYPSDILTFRRFSKPGDLEAFESDTRQAFYSYLTKNYFPPDFGILELSGEEASPDGCEHHARPTKNLYWTVAFTGPLLRLQVAIIENVSNEPITVGRFILRENQSDRLQNPQEVGTALASKMPEKQSLFGPGTLKPGESLVVPIELSLKMEKRDLELALANSRRQVTTKYQADILRHVKAAGGLGSTNIDLPRSTVSAETLESIMRRDRIDFLSTTEYVYGPSVSIESLEINKFGYLVRRFDPSKLLIISGFDDTDVGSCPVVYTYAGQEKSWLKEGVVLYGYNSKLKESTDRIALHRFDGRILIKERDPEDSFIDSIHILAIDKDGREITLHPDNIKLLSNDGDYVRLTQGDHLVVDFKVPDGFIAQKYVLVASGYYVPFSGSGTLPRGLRRRTREFRLPTIR